MRRRKGDGVGFGLGGMSNSCVPMPVVRHPVSFRYLASKHINRYKLYHIFQA